MSPLSLCIVDDEPIIRAGLASLPWERIGVQVAACLSDGLEAVEVLQSELIDVVLADIRMPGMDGLELAEFIRSQQMSTAIVLLSGYSDFGYAQRAIDLGVVSYLLKPSTDEETLAAVQRAGELVSRRRATDTRLKLLESELGRQRLVAQDGRLVLGSKPYGEVAASVLDYLRGHFREPISLASMSQALSFSSIYLSRVVKRETGHTFLELLNGLRLHEAARLLRETSRTFSDIAQSVGANDARYFSQVFRRAFGVTPMAYRSCPSLPLDHDLFLFVATLVGTSDGGSAPGEPDGGA